MNPGVAVGNADLRSLRLAVYVTVQGPRSGVDTRLKSLIVVSSLQASFFPTFTEVCGNVIPLSSHMSPGA